MENHHFTLYFVGNCLYLAGRGVQGAFSTSASDFALDIESKYTSGGFKFKNDLWRVEGLLVDAAGEHVYAAAQADNKVVKYSLRDWQKVAEIKTGQRPDPMLLIPSR